jgi:hypothetical protein
LLTFVHKAHSAVATLMACPGPSVQPSEPTGDRPR